MQHLQAHWRVDYVKIPREDRRSPFASLLAEKDKREALLLYSDRHTFIAMNRYPYNPGHLLVLPRREVGNLWDLTDKERWNLWESIFLGEEMLRQALQPQGFNVGFNLGMASGAGIPSHLHCHVVPRWEGDTNFMPVIGSVKVVSQSLEALYDQLLPFFQGVDPRP
ncbi:MAG: HIT domain-containing protein [Puniceicoccales bacterium]|jgi:ATP adenylyltransferase|nr:HIT domain-containing protein [Puniceicoccales bacterium]